MSSPTSSPNIPIVGPFIFPADSAPARRIEILAKLFQIYGFTPVVGSGQSPKGGLQTPSSFSDFQVHPLSEIPAKETWGPIKAIRHLLWGGNTVRWLRALVPKPKAVLLAGGYTPYSVRLLPWSRRTGVPIIIDAIEWYEPSHITGGPLGPFRIECELAMHYFYPQAHNIICISRYLQRHFEAKGCHTLYLPAVLDVTTISPRLEARPGEAPLRLASTGTPGKKDLRDPMVEALLRLAPDGARSEWPGPRASEA